MSSKPVIKYILFDVADTLLHKPALWETINATLAKAGVTTEITAIMRAHRATRELLTVPDQTGRDFYLVFNTRFLEVLGVLPTEALAEQIYLDCRSLPWEPFADTTVIKELGLPVGVISNWDSSLREKLASHFAFEFSPIIISEEVGFAKPDPRIYESALKATGMKPEEILFIGDSIHLDLVPALFLGLKAVLVDRNRFYTAFNGIRIESLDALPALLGRTLMNNREVAWSKKLI